MIRPLDNGYRADVDTRARTFLIAALVLSGLGAVAHRVPGIPSLRLWVLAPLKPALTVAGGVRSSLVEAVSHEPSPASNYSVTTIEQTVTAARAVSLQNELNELRATLSLPAHYASRGVLASVTVGVAGLPQNMLMIDRGSRSSIRKGSVVVGLSRSAEGNRVGIIGRVVEVGPNISKVLTVLDPSCRIPARVGEHSGFVLAGVPQRSLARLDFVSRDIEVKPGDAVMSSEDGSLFPEGLLLGTVKTVDSVGAGRGVFHEIYVEPALSLGTVRYAWVLTDQPEPDRRAWDHPPESPQQTSEGLGQASADQIGSPANANDPVQGDHE